MGFHSKMRYLIDLYFNWTKELYKQQFQFFQEAEIKLFLNLIRPLLEWVQNTVKLLSEVTGLKWTWYVILLG